MRTASLGEHLPSPAKPARRAPAPWWPILQGVPAGRRSWWVAGGTAAAGVLLDALGPGSLWGAGSLWEAPSWSHTAILLTASAMLIARTTRPLQTLLGVSALFLLDLSAGGSLSLLVVLWDALHAAARYGSQRLRRGLAVILAGVVLAVSIALWATLGDLRIALLTGLQFSAVLFTPWWWASNVRQQAELAGLAENRAEQAELLASFAEVEAVREERRRMARELHDVVAAQLAAIAIHSEAALSRDRRPEGDDETLRAIREASLEGLDDMRAMIGLLRGGDEARLVPGDVGRLPELVREAEGEGMRVTLRQVPGTLPELPAVVGHAAFLILQESLMNARKHAPGGSVEVDVRVEGRTLVLDVRSRQSDGRGTPRSDPGPRPGLGLGLKGLAERVAVLGGGFTAGPGPGTGEWSVRARLTLEGGLAGGAS